MEAYRMLPWWALVDTTIVDHGLQNTTIVDPGLQNAATEDPGLHDTTMDVLYRYVLYMVVFCRSRSTTKYNHTGPRPTKCCHSGFGSVQYNHSGPRPTKYNHTTDQAYKG